MDIISKKWITLGISATLVALSLIFIAVFGFKQGIDLKGGTKWQINFFNNSVSEQQLIQAFEKIRQNRDFSVQSLSGGGFIVNLPHFSEEEHQAAKKSLTEQFGDFKENFSSVGPTIGAELKTKAIRAIILVLIGISLYVAWAFRKVSRPIKSWKYGLVTLITLFHDVAIPAGFFALLGKIKGLEIDTNFIVALLTIMGFSVHDTIVVFNRIRENLLVNRTRNISLAEIINRSVKETFARSVNTSLTLFLVLIALLIFGPQSLFYFVLTILVGTFFGTYSSIFVASPLLYLWQKKSS